MALSDFAIKAGLELGHIVIHPFDPKSLSSASYDVRLGEYFYEARQAEQEEVREPIFYNIYSVAGVRATWEQKSPLAARLWKEAYPKADWSGFRDDDRIIMLAPRANLLCHTQEFIGARTESTTMMKARSSIGRSLVNVCQCAGMGDVGYVNRWTMEFYNRSTYYIPLKVGSRVAQIVFLETGPTEKVYVSKYQGTDDLEALERDWRPESMLPALYRDREIVELV